VFFVFISTLEKVDINFVYFYFSFIVVWLNFTFIKGKTKDFGSTFHKG
jgi:hypothetical protein